MEINDFFEEKKREINVLLSDVQRKGVEHSDGALLMLASPGSGKTTTIIMKVGFLIKVMKIKGSRILAVTFSNASADDMKDRFDRFFPELNNEGMDFSTIHSFSYKIVREYLRKKNQKFQIIEGDINLEDASSYGEDGQILNKRYILRNLFRSIMHTNITEDEMDALLTYMSYVKNKMIPQHELKDVKCTIPCAAQVFVAYEEYKKKDPSKLLVDYDDMLSIANQALDEDSDLLTKYQNMFDYILTDESQDTSLVQHRIIEKLVAKHGNLCVVADDDQSIYEWRGASVEYLLKFKEVYPNATILMMEQNYRSTKDIVDVSNVFIKRNQNRYDKNMFTTKGAFEPIRIKQLDTYDAQLQYVIEELKHVEDFRSVAILYRNNSSSIALINALDYAGIPFYIKDSDNKFFTHWIIEDILNFMRMSYTDKRPAILEKIHTKFNGYISKSQIEYLKTVNNNESVFDNLKKLELPVFQRKQLDKCKETFKKINDMKPKQAIQVIRKSLGYENSIVKMAERLGMKKEMLIGTLNTLESIAGSLERLEDFVERLKHLEGKLKSSKFNKRKQALTLSTFHSSKGLEFDRVFMIDLVDGVIPTNDVIKDYKEGKIEEMEEAVRLFYVGMTRAKLILELLSYRKKDGEVFQESIFVKDVRKIMFPNKTIKKGAKQPKAEKKQAKINPNAIRDIANLFVSMEITHAAFGKGVIEKVDEKIIAIRFEGIGMKHLATPLVVEKGMLEKCVS